MKQKHLSYMTVDTKVTDRPKHDRTSIGRNADKDNKREREEGILKVL
jgi:hypothetical protein